VGSQVGSHRQPTQRDPESTEAFDTSAVTRHPATVADASRQAGSRSHRGSPLSSTPPPHAKVPFQRCALRHLTHMVDMQVIARHQDRGALRLDHLHDQALCEPEGRGDLLITHIMPMSGCSAFAWSFICLHTAMVAAPAHSGSLVVFQRAYRRFGTADNFAECACTCAQIARFWSSSVCRSGSSERPMPT
jgi:hypothetical protein